MGYGLHLTLPNPLPTSSRYHGPLSWQSLNPRLLSYCWGLHITLLHPCHTSSRYWNLICHFRHNLFFALEIFSFAIPVVVRTHIGKFLTFPLVILQSHDLHANFHSQLFSRWLLPSLRLTGYHISMNFFLYFKYRAKLFLNKDIFVLILNLHVFFINIVSKFTRAKKHYCYCGNHYQKLVKVRNLVWFIVKFFIFPKHIQILINLWPRRDSNPYRHCLRGRCIQPILPQGHVVDGYGFEPPPVLHKK